ncbi:lysophospholipid acyltransferase family protein [Ferrovibrio sp.]|uniref:lysophospholipid acyltransferase family protein n=1 Tax=Ferrovibrio sp. TaxID=1917215 RepID=UPI003D09D8C4
MSLVKRLLRSDAALNFASATIALYIRLVRATSRWQTIGAEYPQAQWDQHKACVVVFWHGRLLLMPPAWQGSTFPLHMLSSQHRDADLIVRSVARFGIKTIRGSTANPKKADKDKGGRAALRALLTVLKQGNAVGFTPDGPRGPRMQVSPGVIATARLAKVPILPITYSTRRRKMINTWDRFILPALFTSGVTIWGEPIDVSSNNDESLEQAALRVEAALNAITAQADRLCGHVPVEPAPRDK